LLFNKETAKKVDGAQQRGKGPHKQFGKGKRGREKQRNFSQPRKN